jgi:cytidylate kinase
MKNDLLKYMSDRYHWDKKKEKYPGPVITISREYGCPAKQVAIRLAKLLTEKTKNKGKKKDWKWISKEILFEAAKELELDPSNIQYVFNYEKKSMIDDILSAHSNKYYKSDRRIRNTIARVIRNISYDGNVIIVGRGGVAITRDIEKSLHIHLEAPVEWRALRASQKHNISVEQAYECAADIDQKRKEFREYFEGKGTDYTQFDMTFNCMTLSVDEIAQGIFDMIMRRELL